MITTDPPELATWLATAREALLFDAWTLTAPASGTVVRWLDADFDYTLPDARAFVRGPVIKRGDLRQSVGLSVDNLDVTFYPVFKEAPVNFGAQTLLQAAQRGILRGAMVQIERLVFDTALVYKGRWVEHAGTLAVKNTAGGLIKCQVLSELNRLDKPMPPDVYQSQCRSTVFDPQCGLNRATWAVEGAVTIPGTGPAARSQFAADPADAAGWFDQGVVQFTSGANAGEKRTVKSWAGGVFSFALPWPQDVEAGDEFVAVPGCNRSMAMCSAKFSNLLHYRGEPFVPKPETVN